ncbi:MAG: tyrosine-type recombinase/integrase [Aureispira sp.]|nr:tyrosine-type recombinase/integrase [Aureispira sp.]
MNGIKSKEKGLKSEEEIPGLSTVLKRLKNRMLVGNLSPASIISYSRAISKLSVFHKRIPDDLDLDEIMDFLVHLKEVDELKWRTIKLYVAGLRYYYQEIVEEIELSGQIPYPKEKPSLPQIMSREELSQLFSGCLNLKHKVLFRLLYSSGLRRMELLNLKISDIETKDGKRRIRVNKGKGGKDRYTVLSEKVLDELRIYFKSCRPKGYLFNGQKKGSQMSKGALRHALNTAVKRSQLNRSVTPHILRHCFASHSLEEGMNIKTLQYLLGHQSIQTTLIYLHISEVPLSKAFSPLDKWEQDV